MKTIPEYHKEIISQYSANTWVLPTNYNSNNYSVFADLFEWGLVERKIEDVFTGKTLVGKKFYFKYTSAIL